MIIHKTDKFFKGFAWALPSAFAEPLANCQFERGDVLYNTKQAYEGTWNEALPHIKYSIQVLSPMRGTNIKLEKNTEKKTEEMATFIFKNNWKSNVEFTLTDYKTKKTTQIKTTQGRLYSLLWKGDISILDNTLSDPPVPILAKQVLKNILDESEFVKKNIPNAIQDKIVFLMPFDSSRQILKMKLEKVENALSKFIYHSCFFSPYEINPSQENGLQKEFAPTVKIACFTIENESISNIERTLKQVLYTPAKEKKTEKEMFRINAHGLLFKCI